ncbi:uncharacterized protein LOC126966109 [Leptidea sinapis]|uniref:uncharacterized protein LOC126966109 n=1 Tax=Leptidea sinapis TaxID=189913 RepID=UPI0021C2C74A|nr:uncharacterized protein LOC126966109 [Leptidea sinapis]
MAINSSTRSNIHQHSEEFDVPLEVFRNNTTAVEVVVKNVTNKNEYPKKDTIGNVKEIARLYKDIEILKASVDKANQNLDRNRKLFGTVLSQIQKQLEVANQRELREQTKNLLLQLEKEKLKTELESKTNLVMKLKRELLSVRRLFKTIIKEMQTSEKYNELISDNYQEFES